MLAFCYWPLFTILQLLQVLDSDNLYFLKGLVPSQVPMFKADQYFSDIETAGLPPSQHVQASL